jgi:hypothetical protein
VKIIGRWHDVAARTGVVIFESNDPAAVQRYLGQWNPYMESILRPCSMMRSRPPFIDRSLPATTLDRIEPDMILGLLALMMLLPIIKR